MSLAVRNAVRADLRAIADRLHALDAEGWSIDPRHDVARDPKIWRETIEWMLFADHHAVPAGWIAERDGTLVGVLVGQLQRGEHALGHPPRGKIAMLWVDDAVRRQGIGRALVEAFVARLGRDGVTDCDVTTLVRDERALAFWRSMGFADQYLSLRRNRPAGREGE